MCAISSLLRISSIPSLFNFFLSLIILCIPFVLYCVSSIPSLLSISSISSFFRASLSLLHYCFSCIPSLLRVCSFPLMLHLFLSFINVFFCSIPSLLCLSFFHYCVSFILSLLRVCSIPSVLRVPSNPSILHLFISYTIACVFCYLFLRVCSSICRGSCNGFYEWRVVVFGEVRSRLRCLVWCCVVFFSSSMPFSWFCHPAEPIHSLCLQCDGVLKVVGLVKLFIVFCCLCIYMLH